MKNHFPFTDYDIYAYLTSGSLLMAVLDFVLNDAAIIAQKEWNFVQIVLAVASAYVLGHLIAWVSQMIIEMWLMRRVLSAPIEIQLAFSSPNLIERLAGRAVGRYYEPFREPVRRKMIDVASKKLEVECDKPIDAEAVFQVAHGYAMGLEAVRDRSDSFRNQYGLFRNMTLVGLTAIGVLAWTAWYGYGPERAGLLMLLAGALTLASFVRFAKFYCSFSAEILRSLIK